MISNRQLDVLRILLRDEKTTVTNIARELEVNNRTIERHINNLTIAGVPIDTKRGRYGGVSIDKRYKHRTALFTENNIFELFIALSIHENIFYSECKEEVAGIFGLTNPDYSIRKIEMVKKYFEVDLFERPIDVRKELIEIISDAMEKDLLIKFTMKNKDFKMKPISFILKKEGVFLYGIYDKYILYNLNRIKNIRIVEEEFKCGRVLSYRENNSVEIIY